MKKTYLIPAMQVELAKFCSNEENIFNPCNAG